ncbi:OLC1v1002546C1 [Oldenlandia corymbosa var. corymbosa]|uniref:OLC1v1002546C1 n=1 Tax=Oldenlandia corymbosa var. corymbosa TaxID=529605 RepID=A0AAV1D7X5_OLDCO|nr:OLC1v1002546C1 [Oldenlandia corymbosa var. corymbosa]
MSTSNQQETGPSYVGKIAGSKVDHPYERVRWTDDMVKLLITAMSYVAEYDALNSDHSEAKIERFLIPKTGKWRAISNVMLERGYRVSPHQCEDKFNDLNKKYKRLNVLLGRGTACQVVENPELIGSVDLSDKELLEVVKILSCKQLFYREMCSFNNRNRECLPHDPSVHDSLLLALIKGKGNRLPEAIHEISAGRMKEVENPKVAGTKRPLRCNASSKGEKLVDKTMSSRLLDLEKEKLHIQKKILEVEKLILIESQKKDLELEKMRMENKMIKLENQRIAFEIRQQMIKRNISCCKRDE